MQFRRSLVSLAAAVAALPGVSLAQEWQGFYAGIHLGYDRHSFGL